MKDWTRVGLDCGLLNYPEGDNQIFRIDSYADVYTVRQFVHNLTADIVAENARLRDAVAMAVYELHFSADEHDCQGCRDAAKNIIMIAKGVSDD